MSMPRTPLQGGASPDPRQAQIYLAGRSRSMPALAMWLRTGQMPSDPTAAQQVQAELDYVRTAFGVDPQTLVMAQARFPQQAPPPGARPASGPGSGNVPQPGPAPSPMPQTGPAPSTNADRIPMGQGLSSGAYVTGGIQASAANGNNPAAGAPTPANQDDTLYSRYVASQDQAAAQAGQATNAPSPTSAGSIPPPAGGAERGLNAPGFNNTPSPPQSNGANMSGNLTPPSQAPAAPGVPGMGPSSAQGAYLLDPNTDNTYRVLAIMKQLGYDPAHLGLMGQFVQQKLAPIIQGLAATYGYQNGGNGKNIDPTGAMDFFTNLAKQFITPGQNFFGNVAGAAQNVLGNSAFMNNLNDQTNPQDQFKMLQALLPLEYGGANPLAQAAAQANAARAWLGYQLGSVAGGQQPSADSTFLKWLGTPGAQQDQFRSLLGLAGQ